MSRTVAFWRALRGFLSGFTGIPAARLPTPSPAEARRALAAHASHRPGCC
jgi:hypothetical protein